MASLRNYSVCVSVNGNEKSGDAQGYVVLNHGDAYKLVLRNQNKTDCDAVVKIDGQTVGTFRVRAFSSITLERPADVDKKFHFYLAGTTQATQAGIQKGDSENGHIEVEFRPEQKKVYLGYEPESATLSYNGGFVTKGLSAAAATRGEGIHYQYQAGGTGLSGQSDQKFTSVNSLTYDTANFVTIHLRLVGGEDKNKITPLTGRTYETPVPPPI